MENPPVSLELALQAAMRRQMDEIVRAANGDAALLDGAPRGRGLERKQLSNVLSVAEESQSLLVVTNFIRYQMGRERIGKAWCHNNFGQRLVWQIEDPEGVVSRQTIQVLELLLDECKASEAWHKRISYELMKSYLGYLQRAFVYGSKGPAGAWQDLRQAAG